MKRYEEQKANDFRCNWSRRDYIEDKISIDKVDGWKKIPTTWIVDTQFTMDHGWETMVFVGDCEGNIISYSDYDCNNYDTFEEANAGHEAMLVKWRNKVKEVEA